MKHMIQSLMAYLQPLLAPQNKVKVNLKHIISQGAHFTGSFVFSGAVHIDGTIDGPVTAEETGTVVLVGPQGLIKGPVTSETVILGGTIEGDIHCSHVIIKAGATLRGNILAATTEIEKGAQIFGAFECQPGYNPLSQGGMAHA